jgi:hypothetical protein
MNLTLRVFPAYPLLRRDHRRQPRPQSQGHGNRGRGIAVSQHRPRLRRSPGSLATLAPTPPAHRPLLQRKSAVRAVRQDTEGPHLDLPPTVSAGPTPALQHPHQFLRHVNHAEGHQDTQSHEPPRGQFRSGDHQDPARCRQRKHSPILPLAIGGPLHESGCFQFKGTTPKSPSCHTTPPTASLLLSAG